MSRGIWSVLTPGRLGAQGVWSPDGSRLAFIRTVDGNPDLFVGPSSADGSDTLLVHSDELKGLNTWSHDGTTVLYNRVPRGAPSDVWAVVVASGKMFPVANSGAAELDSQLSTDDRWVAYQIGSVWPLRDLRPAIPAAGRSDSSDERWRRAGPLAARRPRAVRIDLEERLIAVPIPSGTGGESLEFGNPRPLSAFACLTVCCSLVETISNTCRRTTVRDS